MKALQMFIGFVALAFACACAMAVADCLIACGQVVLGWLS